MAKRERVPAGEFQRSFGYWRTVAHRRVVTIISDGRDDLVVLAADEYEKLRRHEQRAFHVSELPHHIIDELGAVPLAEEGARFDYECR